MRNKQQSVKIWARPSKDGRRFTYYLRYVDLDGKYKNYKSDISNTLKEIDKSSREILKALKMQFVN